MEKLSEIIKNNPQKSKEIMTEMAKEQIAFTEELENLAIKYDIDFRELLTAATAVYLGEYGDILAKTMEERREIKRVSETDGRK